MLVSIAPSENSVSSNSRTSTRCLLHCDKQDKQLKEPKHAILGPHRKILVNFVYCYIIIKYLRYVSRLSAVFQDKAISADLHVTCSLPNLSSKVIVWEGHSTCWYQDYDVCLTWISVWSRAKNSIFFTEWTAQEVRGNNYTSTVYQWEPVTSLPSVLLSKYETK